MKMKTLTQLTTTAGTKRSVSRALVVLAISLALTTASQAVSITGDPLPANPFGWDPNSSNALNYDKQVPGRIGQDAPYVLFNSHTTGSVTLDFFNFAPGLAFFETRIDGIATGATPHPVVTGDTIHTGGTSVPAALDFVLGKTFNANSYVDIRLALGGERDWDFDWVRFEVAPSSSVPDAGGTLSLLGLGLAGIGVARRRK